MYLFPYCITWVVCEDYLTCGIAFNAVMPLSRVATHGRYSRIEGVTSWHALKLARPKTADSGEELGNHLIHPLHIIVHHEALVAWWQFEELCVMPSMRLYLLRVEARLRGITALKAMSQVR